MASIDYQRLGASDRQKLEKARVTWQDLRYVAVQNTDDSEEWERLIANMDSALDGNDEEYVCEAPPHLRGLFQGICIGVLGGFFVGLAIAAAPEPVTSQSSLEICKTARC